MELGMFLQWLLASGGSVSVVSWICERWDYFQKQTADVKEYIFTGLAAAISVGAYVVITYVPAAILALIAPYFLIVSGIFITVIVGKMFHKIDKAAANSVSTTTDTKDVE